MVQARTTWVGELVAISFSRASSQPTKPPVANATQAKSELVREDALFLVKHAMCSKLEATATMFAEIWLTLGILGPENEE